MGYIRHDIVVAVVPSYSKDAKEIGKSFRKMKRNWPTDLPKLLFGPSEGINGYKTYFFGPDGSKEGWESSDRADALRNQFMGIMNGEFCSVVHLQTGGDDRKTKILSTTDYDPFEDSNDRGFGRGTDQ